MKLFKIAGWVLAVVLLTVVSQVGGLILLVCIPVFRLSKKRFSNRPLPHFINAGFFLAIYFVCITLLVPPLASFFGRVPLPITGQTNLKPLNYATWFFNRHYVVPDLKTTLLDASQEMEEKYPGTIIAYLDAGFPFLNNFPLLPHLSHDDGKKADIAFFYRDKSTDEPLNRKAPSFIGYGVFEGPISGESNYPERCKAEGFWQYSILGRFVPQGGKQKMKLDQERTAALIRILSRQPEIGKIFLEPHLKERFGLSSNKVRYHGCHAVRHDDHIHVQL